MDSGPDPGGSLPGGDRDPRVVGAQVVTFVVRMWREPPDRWSGTVEHVRTGRKERFEDVGSVGRLIEQALALDTAGTPGPGS